MQYVRVVSSLRLLRRRGSHEAGDVRQPAVAAARAAGLDGRPRARVEADDAERSARPSRPSPATAVAIFARLSHGHGGLGGAKRHADTAMAAATALMAPSVRETRRRLQCASWGCRSGLASGPGTGAGPAFQVAPKGARLRVGGAQADAGNCGSSPGLAPCQSQTGRGGGARRASARRSGLRLTTGSLSAAPPFGKRAPGATRSSGINLPPRACHRQGDRGPASAVPPAAATQAGMGLAPPRRPAARGASKGPGAPSARPRASARAVAECRARLPLGGFQRPASRGTVAAASVTAGSTEGGTPSRRPGRMRPRRLHGGAGEGTAK